MHIEPIDHGLALHGELDMAGTEAFDIGLQEMMLETGGVFRLDLRDLTFMDSTGVNALLRARALLGRDDRDLAVICPEGPVRRVLDLVGVTELFELRVG